MTIETERIIRYPGSNEVKITPLPKVEPNAESAALILRERITRFISPLRDRSQHVASLFSMGADPEGYIPMKGENSVGYSLEREALQTVGFEIMAEFGFEETKTDETQHTLNTRLDGVITESTVYLSTKVPHLRFTRRLMYKGGTKEPIRVDWEAYYRPPAFEFHLPSFLQKKG